VKEIVLIDIVWNGHVPTYHKYFAQVLLEMGNNVLSISPDPSDVLTWVKRNIPNQSHKIKCVLFERAATAATHETNVHKPRFSKLKSGIGHILRYSNLLPFMYTAINLRNAMNLWRKTNNLVDTYVKQYNLPSTMIIFFPYIDYQFMHRWLPHGLIERLFHFRWAALYLHPTHLRKNPDYKCYLFCPDSILFSKNCIGVSILDEALAVQLKTRIKKPVVWFPDITDNIFDGPISAICKSILERAKGRKITTLLGYISQKKNLILLLKVAEICSERQLPYFFVVAGALQLNSWPKAERHMILSAIEKKDSNVFFHLESLPDGLEYNSFILISDIIFAVYSSFYHSSNALTKAAIFERPVIVSEGHLMAERVIKYQTGFAIQEDNIRKCLDAIICISNGVDFNGFPLKPKFKEYAALHSIDSLRTAFAELLSSSH
jgi:hypothetical protein